MSTREAFEEFFDLLETKVKERNILSHNLANIDKHGLQEGESRTAKVLGIEATKCMYVTASNTINWVTIIEYGTTEGLHLTPYIIFTGGNFKASGIVLRTHVYGEHSTNG